MFGLEEEEVALPPRSQAAPQGRFMAGADDAPAAKPAFGFSGSPSWQMIKLRALPKLSYTAYGLFGTGPDSKLTKITLESGTPLRVYTGAIKVSFADGSAATIKSPNDKGESLVETVPDDKSRFWNIYSDTPANQTLVASSDYAGTGSERMGHLMWLPVNLKGDNPPDLLDEALKAQYDAVQIPAVPVPPTPPDKPAAPAQGGAFMSVALGVGGALLLASLLDSRSKS